MNNKGQKIDPETKRILNYFKWHLEFLVDYLKQNPTEMIIYEYSNYLNRNKGNDTVNLFRLMGALEGLKYTFPNIKAMEAIDVKAVKFYYKKLLAKEKFLLNLNY